MTIIEDSNAERLSRKLRKLLDQNKGQPLLSILFSKSSIKDEYVSLDKLNDERLEHHVDKALEQ